MVVHVYNTNNFIFINEIWPKTVVLIAKICSDWTGNRGFAPPQHEPDPGSARC